MKRAVDSLIDFMIITDTDNYNMTFSVEWKFSEILEYMVDLYSINKDSIVEIRNTYIKHYKLLKDE